MFKSAQALIDTVRTSVPRCLTMQRQAFLLGSGSWLSRSSTDPREPDPRHLDDKIEAHAPFPGPEASADRVARSLRAVPSHAFSRPLALFRSWICHISNGPSGPLPQRLLRRFWRQNAVKAPLPERPGSRPNLGISS